MPDRNKQIRGTYTVELFNKSSEYLSSLPVRIDNPISAETAANSAYSLFKHPECNYREVQLVQMTWKRITISQEDPNLKTSPVIRAELEQIIY